MESDGGMERSGGGMFGRVAERALGWVAAAALLFLGIAIYQMSSETKAAIWSGIWRTGAWIVIVAALPWVSRFFIRRLLEVGENWIGLALIGALTLADVVAAVVLMTGWPAGVWGWLASLGALAVAATYNYYVSEYLAETAGRL